MITQILCSSHMTLKKSRSVIGVIEIFGIRIDLYTSNLSNIEIIKAHDKLVVVLP